MYLYTAQTKSNVALLFLRQEKKKKKKKFPKLKPET